MNTTTPPDSPPESSRTHSDYRVLGLDRSQAIPAAVVLAIGLVWGLGLPWLDRSVSWNDPIAAGDVVDLGKGVHFTPPVGWDLTQGVRVGDEPASGPLDAGSTATVTDGGTTISATQGVFAGDVDALLAEAEKHLSVHEKGVRVSGARQSVTTDSGLVGTSEPFTSTSGDGVLAAFVLPSGSGPAAGGRWDHESDSAPTAITFAARSQPGQSTADATEIEAALRSLTYGGPR
ncbi:MULTISPECIES: hypothetical protein [unclassified Dietzia]|uniref:hypothetical protein n=1 Tax=unclassified Dietzia TaxID=2617939 RepID=UPI000D2168EA|nr:MULTISPECIES: hypothetical protein [unclassified Dietzia]AVZ40249.1 hypothetical protein CT688_13010 [Dietzia sp. JS16-p6b]QGW25717.1 hypothetical protein GJR88_04132 [Dietzia sp. DQ12-45-1b]